MKKKLLSIVFLLALSFTLAACGKKDKSDDKLLTQDSKDLLSGQHNVEIEIENYGTIALTLDADIAPVSVTNFINLVEEDFYDGLTFHRIIDGFMIQGGDPEGNGSGGSAQNIQGEFSSNGIKNSLAHTRGVISMARAKDPDSASSQFFIVHEDSPHLDGDYAAFGWVTSGIEVVDAICNSTPVEDFNGTVKAKNQPVITDIRIVTKDQDESYTSTSGDNTQNNTISTDSTLLTNTSEGLLSGQYNVEIEIEHYGTIALTLDADIAPVTVTNFIDLVQNKFYDGLTFHRIIDGFMIQGGDPEGTGMGGSSRHIQGEFASNGIENNLAHTRGVISMARAGYSNDSASSQFFIMHKDAPHLDGAYAAFGWVTSGIEVVDAICEATPVIDGNGTVLAKNQPVITEIRIVE